MTRVTIYWAVILFAIIGCSQQESELNIFTWSNYISDEIVEGFKQETDIQKVSVTTYDSNESLLARLQAGAKGYDIVMPSDYMVSIMIKQGLLAEINKANIPNFANISRFTDQYFDPGNRYSVPFDWGTAGIAYDSAMLEEPPDSWVVFWDKKYQGKFSMLDDIRECFAVALKSLGYSVNTTNPQELEAAKQKLIQQKPLVKRYDSQAAEALLAGEVIMAHAWSGDAFRAASEKPTIRYTIPKEGGTVFIDNICIPKDAPHKETAEKFINYLLRPEINAKITDFTQYATCIDAARQYVKPELRDNPIIYLPDEIMARLEWLKDLGDFLPQYDLAWTEVKASQ